jgi:hypothetical protein
MNNKNNRISFLDYINTPMSKESILILYSANNIKYEKCELYNDFVQSLLMLAFDTYMGDDITDIDEQINHFKWCWNTNVFNFQSEGVLFESSKLFNYFLEFMLEVYYSCMDKSIFEYSGKTVLVLWDNIFDYNRIKTNADMDTLIEIYRIFDKSLKNIQ